MNSNPICQPSPANKMKCSFLDYIQLLIISRACQWTWTPSTTCLHAKKLNAHILIMFNFWCWPDWSMDSNPIHHPSAANKMKCFFLDYVHFWWSAWLVDGLKPHLPPLSTHKNEMLNFQLRSTSDDQPSWSIDSKSICQPSPANKMKCFFLDYVYFWWSTRLVDGLKPHLHPSPAKKMKCSLFGLRSTSDDQLGWSMDSNPIHHPSPAKKMKCSFFDYVQLLMISWACQWTQTPSASPLQPIKWNASFWIMFNFWWSRLVRTGSPAMKCHFLNVQPWAINGLTPSSTLSSQKMKCSFLDYVQLLMISRAGRWTQTPSATPLQPIKWNAHFWIKFNFWWSAGLVDGLKPHSPPLSTQKNEMHIFYVQLLMIPGWSMDSNPIHCPSAAKKMKCFFFGLHSTSDDWPGWVIDSNPIHHPSPANKMKCFFLDYIQLLMISWAGWWTQTPFTTPLQPKKWNAHFWIMFNFWWSAGLVNGLKPHPPPLSSQRNEMLIFGLCSTSNDRLGWSMDSNPIHHPSPAKTVKCSFLYYIQHMMLARQVNGLEPHPPPLSSQKKMKCSFFDYVQLLMISWAGRWT